MIYRRMFDLSPWRFRRSFDELERMRQDMKQFFDVLSEGGSTAVHSGVYPLINLTEDKENYFIRAELPGAKSEDLDIQVTANTISITGERKIPVEAGNVKYHRREREAGKFSRMIGLPGDVASDKVDAKLSDGVLTIRIPKAESAKPRQITVS